MSNSRRKLEPIQAPQSPFGIDAPAGPDPAATTSRRQRRRNPDPEAEAPLMPAGDSKPKATKAPKPDDLVDYKPGPGDPDKRSIRKAFDKFDKDGSKSIEVEELELMLKVFGMGADSNEVGHMLTCEAPSNRHRKPCADRIPCDCRRAESLTRTRVARSAWASLPIC